MIELDYNKKEDCISLLKDYEFLIGQLNYFRDTALKLVTDYYISDELKQDAIYRLEKNQALRLIKILHQVYMLHNDAVKDKD